jgi:GxxExxY protein
VHKLYAKADALSKEVIGAAIEVHRVMGPGLIESVYEKCLQRELELRGLRVAKQMAVTVEYKGLVFEDNLRCDLLVEDCLLVELKAVETLHPVNKAQLLSYMRLLDVPVGLLINFHETLLKRGVHRLYLPGANRSL